MNKAVLIGIIAIVVVVAVVGAFLVMPQGPQARTIQLEAKEFGFNDFKGGPTIRAKTGETIRIVLKNAGGADHEFIVVEKLKAEMHPEPVFAGAMSEATKPGQTSAITFKAEKAGKYFYGCFLDGGTKPQTHADRGMFGEFMVEG